MIHDSSFAIRFRKSIGFGMLGLALLNILNIEYPPTRCDTSIGGRSTEVASRYPLRARTPGFFSRSKASTGTHKG